MKSISLLADQLGVTPAIIRSWQINLNLDHPRYSPEEPAYDEQWQRFFAEVARLRKQGQSFSRIRTTLVSEMPARDTLPEPGQHKAPAGNGNGNGSAPKAQPVEAPQPERVAERVTERVSEREPAVAETASPLSFSFNSKEPRSYAPEEPGHSLVRVNPDANLPSVQNLQRNMHEALIHQDMTKMAQTYVQLMENFQTLSQRYTESAYVIGQLEEKNRSIENLMHEKEEHFQDKEKAQIKRIQELEDHLNSLKSNLDKREADLSQSKDQLVTKDEITQVEKQLKLLAVSVFQQQEELKNSQNAGFWQKLKQRLFKS